MPDGVNLRRKLRPALLRKPLPATQLSRVHEKLLLRIQHDASEPLRARRVRALHGLGPAVWLLRNGLLDALSVPFDAFSVRLVPCVCASASWGRSRVLGGLPQSALGGRAGHGL